MATSHVVGITLFAAISSESTEPEPRSGATGSDPEHPRRVAVAVFAHPDDDLIIGPLLAHYAKLGSDMHVVSVTSGRQGSAHTDIPAGSELAVAREAELRAACERYGVHEPRFLRYHDGQLSSLSNTKRDALKRAVRDILQEVGAQVVITFGKDGYTGHTDHVTVSAVATEVLDEWYSEPGAGAAPAKLYYTMCPASVARELPPTLQWFVAVDDRMATTIVDAVDGVEDASQAVQCYATQFPPPLAEDVKVLYRHAMDGRVHLRCVRSNGVLPVSGETDIFA
jgi:LmbE family N-acetylglucosaminyl deacetylase